MRSVGFRLTGLVERFARAKGWLMERDPFRGQWHWTVSVVPGGDLEITRWEAPGLAHHQESEPASSCIFYPPGLGGPHIIGVALPDLSTEVQVFEIGPMHAQMDVYGVHVPVARGEAELSFSVGGSRVASTRWINVREFASIEEVMHFDGGIVEQRFPLRVMARSLAEEGAFASASIWCHVTVPPVPCVGQWMVDSVTGALWAAMHTELRGSTSVPFQLNWDRLILEANDGDARAMSEIDVLCDYYQGCGHALGLIIAKWSSSLELSHEDVSVLEELVNGYLRS